MSTTDTTAMAAGYPVGRWYATTSRDERGTLWQRIDVRGGRLAVLQSWSVPPVGDVAAGTFDAICLRDDTEEGDR